MSRFRGEYIKDRKALHNAVRADAGNRCIRCGHPAGDKLGPPTRRFEFAAQGFAEGEPRRELVLYENRVLMPCDGQCHHSGDGKLRILTVHHLTGQKDDNRWWNLLALCQVCHLQVQGKVIPEVPYLWQHSDWFIPYACGFYAAYYGNRDITREQADARPDDYLSLGQPWLYHDRARCEFCGKWTSDDDHPCDRSVR